MSQFTSDLDLRELPDGTWRLLSDLCYESDLLGPICVPAGTETDLASVPRLPFMFWFYGDRVRRPAALHDYLYRSKKVTRELADAVFAEAMESLGIAPWTRGPMWAAVRLFGWTSY